MASILPRLFSGFLVIIITIATVCCLETDSPLRVERLLHMEEEMIDFSEFVMEQERRYHKTDNVDELHSYGDFTEFLKKAKYANALSFNDTSAVSRDAVAIFHLKKRLTEKWLPHFKLLRASEMIQESKTLEEKMDNIVKVIKQECDVKNVMENILRLKEMFGLSIKAIIEGKIDPQLPTNPIHAADIADIAEYVAERNSAKEGLAWMEYAMAQADKKSEIYLKLLSRKGRLLLRDGDAEESREAMAIYEKLMKLEPKKRSHKSSYEYAKMRVSSTVLTEKLAPKNQTVPFWHNVCNGRYLPNPENQKHLQCYERHVDGHHSALQIEELHRSPKVVMVRNLFKHDVIDGVLAGYSKEILGRLMGDTYRVNVRTRSVPTILSRQYMNPLYDTICNVTFADTQLKLLDSVTPIMITEEGPGGNEDYVSVTHQNHVMKTRWHTLPVAHYGIFLSDVQHGGGIAFPNIRLLVKPEKGSAVFWSFKTMKGPVHPGFRKVVNCPPLIGTQWLAKATLSHNFIYDDISI